MGKAANFEHKSHKSPVILYRIFMKISLACTVYSAFRIIMGSTVQQAASTMVLAVMGAIAYELSYYIYKNSGKNAEATSEKELIKKQIKMLLKLSVFFLGFSAVIFGSVLLSGGKYYGIALICIGIAGCQFMHNNKYLFSHLSTLCENLSAGAVIIALDCMLNSRALYLKVIFISSSIALIGLQEFFFHFYNVAKNDKNKIQKRKKRIEEKRLARLAKKSYKTQTSEAVVRSKDEIKAINEKQTRLLTAIRNSIFVTMLFFVWFILVFIGSVDFIFKSDFSDKLFDIVAMLISIITVAVLLYESFIKKPKPERLEFNPKIQKDAFKSELENRFGAESLSVKALDYVTKTMCKENGHKRIGSGEDYYVHPIAVAKIIMKETPSADDSTVAAALLHDCVEDVKDCKIEKIEKEYGKDVAKTVDLLTKKKGADFDMQKYLDAILTDKSAVLIKSADRMNNNSTMENYSDTDKKEKTDETKQYYIPLARQAGVRYPEHKGFFSLAERFFDQDVV